MYRDATLPSEFYEEDCRYGAFICMCDDNSIKCGLCNEFKDCIQCPNRMVGISSVLFNLKVLEMLEFLQLWETYLRVL
jgi:hypothetical protein